MGMPMPAPKKKMGLGSILTLVGGILLIVGFIMPMVTLTVSYNMFGMTYSDTGSESGLSLALGYDSVDENMAPVKLSYPIFFAVPIMGVLALVLGLLKQPMMKLIAGVMGIVGVVCAYMGYMQVSADIKPMIDAITAIGGSASIGMGFGLYMAIIGGVLALVGGLMGFKQASA
jgi:hypothetical protein